MSAAEQPVTVLVHADTSSLEAKVDNLAQQVREAIAYLKGEVRPGSYTPQQFAELLQVDVRRIYEAIHQGKVLAVQIGGQWRIPKGWADEFLSGIPRQITETPEHGRRVLPFNRG